MRSYEAGLGFGSNPIAYPEDIYLVAYEKTKHLAFSDPPYFGALFQPINAKELQHLIDTADADLPSNLRVSLGGHEYVEWEVTDDFEEMWYKDENATKQLLSLSWVKAPFESGQQYELFHLRILSIGEDLIIEPGDCRWETSSVLGYYIVKEIATDMLTVFRVEVDTGNNPVVRMVEGQERHGLLAKLLHTGRDVSFSDNPLKYASILTVKVSDNYL